MTATAKRLRTTTASRITSEHQSAKVGGASTKSRMASERQSMGLPKPSASEARSAPRPCTSSSVVNSGSHATSTRPARRPPSSVRLPIGRVSSVSATRSRASRARTSNARNTTTTTSAQTANTPSPARMKRGLTTPTTLDVPENIACKNVYWKYMSRPATTTSAANSQVRASRRAERTSAKATATNACSASICRVLRKTTRVTLPKQRCRGVWGVSPRRLPTLVGAELYHLRGSMDLPTLRISTYRPTTDRPPLCTSPSPTSIGPLGAVSEPRPEAAPAACAADCVTGPPANEPLVGQIVLECWT